MTIRIGANINTTNGCLFIKSKNVSLSGLEISLIKDVIVELKWVVD